MAPVKVEARIQEILGKDFILTPEMSFSYSWEHGYEKVTVYEEGKKGGMEFSGAYHPNAICEGGGICRYCGKTLRYD